MAITKIIGAIHPPRSGGRYKVLKNTINYIINPSKTADGLYSGALNCVVDNVLSEMVRTKEHFGKTSDSRHDRLGYHFCISFPPDCGITEDVAYNILKEFCEEYLGSSYETVFAVHNDKDHIHGHLCFNSVDYKSGKKYRYENGDWASYIQPLVDSICKKHGISTLQEDTGMSIDEYEKQRYKSRNKGKGIRESKIADINGISNSNKKYHNETKNEYSWSEHLKGELNDLIVNSTNINDFENNMKNRGFLYKYGNSEKYGKYLKIKCPGMDIYRKTYQLGREYTLERILERIELRISKMPDYRLDTEEKLMFAMSKYNYKNKAPLTLAQRLYLVDQYKYGLRKKGVKINYKDINQSYKRMTQRQNEMQFIVEKNITNSEDVFRKKNEVMSKKEDLLKQRKIIKEDLYKYREAISIYKKIKIAGVEGNFEKMNIYVSKLRDLGKSYGEIESFMNLIKIKRMELTKKIREINRELEMYNKIQSLYEKNMDQELNQEDVDEQILEDVKTKTEKEENFIIGKKIRK